MVKQPAPASRSHHLRWLTAVVGLGLFLPGAMAANAAGLPAYFHEAFDQFQPAVTPGWAYTLTTTKADRTMTERYDPSPAAGSPWTLLRLNGAAPTDQELAQYASAKAGDGNSGPQPAFQKADLEPGSFALVREDAAQAEFRGTFRQVAANADKMLAHLAVHLFISKTRPYVQKFSLELDAPYTPVLGVKMRELTVQMTFHPPGPERPSLPDESSSHFLGRIFFFGTEENVRLTYSDFARSD